MSYLADNIRRLLRDLRSEPLSAFPARLAGIAAPKLVRLVEETAHRTGTGAALARRYRGKGVALMFHEIHTDVDGELRTGCGLAQLERIVAAVRGSGREIVTVAEGLRRLGEPDSRPFALMTFDDAYIDNATNALPLLERMGAPMTLFVPTGMITREIYAWWLGLRELIKTNGVVAIPAMQRRFECADLASKAAAMRQITAWIDVDQAKAETLRPLFLAAGIDIPALVDRYAMSAEQLRAFARHPLVEIGAHTQSHRFLAGLDDGEVEAELRGNKAYLETLLQRPIRYLAYPYGGQDACGAREAALAAAAGFEASFTTRHGHLFTGHLAHPQLLPRLDVGYAPQSPAALSSRLSGLHRMMETRLGDPVATLA